MTASNNHPEVTIGWQNEGTGVFYVQGEVDSWDSPSSIATGVHPNVSIGFTDNTSEILLSGGTTSPYALQRDNISAPYQARGVLRGNASNTGEGRGGTLYFRNGTVHISVLSASVDATPLSFSSISDTTRIHTLPQLENALTTEPFAGNGTLKMKVLFTGKGERPQGSNFRLVLRDAATGQVLQNPRTFNVGQDTLLTVESAMEYGTRQVKLAIQPVSMGQPKRFTLDRWFLVDETSQGRVAQVTSNASGNSQLPTEFALHQNYPNPFNPSTTIKFDLPENSNVTLVVYDVLGRKVAELVNGTREAGYHSATWSASDVASGVYFARFTATDANRSVKLNKVTKLLLTK